MPSTVRDYIRRFMHPTSVEDCYLLFTMSGRLMGYNHYAIKNGEAVMTCNSILGFIFVNIVLTVFNVIVWFFIDYSDYNKESVLKSEAITLQTIGIFGTQLCIAMLVLKRKESHKVVTVLENVFHKVGLGTRQLCQTMNSSAVIM